MPASYPESALRVSPAVLLVLLPPATGGGATTRRVTPASIRALQGRLGPAIRVLQVDEASHPDVVRSFGTPPLPACVLMRQGVELWRQQGLPDDELSVTTLLEAVRAC